MEKLKEKHYQAIYQKSNISKLQCDSAATACAEITKEIATKFAEWAKKNEWEYDVDEKEWYHEPAEFKTTSELFTTFIEQL